MGIQKLSSRVAEKNAFYDLMRQFFNISIFRREDDEKSGGGKV